MKKPGAGAGAAQKKSGDGATKKKTGSGAAKIRQLWLRLRLHMANNSANFENYLSFFNVFNYLHYFKNKNKREFANSPALL